MWCVTPDRAHTLQVALLDEATGAPRLRLVGVDREGVVVAAARMGDVVLAPTERTHVVGVYHVKDQRRVHANGRVQRRPRRPGLVADATDEFTLAARAVQRDLAVVAAQHQA